MPWRRRARPLRGEVDAAVETARRARQRHRQRYLDEVEQRLLSLIRKRELVAAREVLARAGTEMGSESAIEPLVRLLARTVDERIQELVQRAGVAFEAERFEAAAKSLRQVLALDPDNAWIRSRLERAEAGQRLGEEEARRRRDRHQRARDYLREALAARASQDLLKARLLVAKALELKPEDREAAALAKDLDQQDRAAELSSLRTNPLSPALMKAYTDIEGLRATGDALGAWKRLNDAIEEFGEIDAFASLRRTLAEEILDDDGRSEV